MSEDALQLDWPLGAAPACVLASHACPHCPCALPAHSHIVLRAADALQLRPQLRLTSPALLVGKQVVHLRQGECTQPL